MNKQVNSLTRQLKEAGFKVTRQRKQIISGIVGFPQQHFNADQIHRHVSQTRNGIGIATVFRTLPILEDAGIICRVKLDGPSAFFELHGDSGKHQHHHLICTTCGIVLELDIDWLDQLEIEIDKIHHFQVQNHHLNFYGLCQHCQVNSQEHQR